MEPDKAEVGQAPEANISALPLPDGTDPLSQQVLDGNETTKKRKKFEPEANSQPPSYSFRANRYLPLVALYKKNTTIWARVSYLLFMWFVRCPRYILCTCCVDVSQSPPFVGFLVISHCFLY